MVGRHLTSESERSSTGSRHEPSEQVRTILLETELTELNPSSFGISSRVRAGGEEGSGPGLMLQARASLSRVANRRRLSREKANRQSNPSGKNAHGPSRFMSQIPSPPCAEAASQVPSGENSARSSRHPRSWGSSRQQIGLSSAPNFRTIGDWIAQDRPSSANWVMKLSSSITNVRSIVDMSQQINSLSQPPLNK